MPVYWLHRFRRWRQEQRRRFERLLVADAGREKPD